MSREVLSPSDFGDFYKEVYGRRPFDWQDKLARTVCERGWPRYLDMPTASGKTSVIDIAVFHLALEGCKRGRRAPLRIAFVVDRRLVVDGAFEHAQALACKIAAGEGDVTKLVARALEAFMPSSPLGVVRLRGGMPHETDWARTPSRPTVIVSTVDQVGSRLLFRGYGVSHSMRPVHAGLLGNDTLFLLDEAHTSWPFLDTLVRVSEMKGEWQEEHPIQCMFMSATLKSSTPEKVFPPQDDAEALLRGDEALSRRLGAHKHARLVEVGANDKVEAIVTAALDLAHPKKPRKGHPPRNIGVVVNRVGLARRIHGELLDRAHKRDGGAEVHLLTGRARPIERDRVLGPKIDAIRPSKGGAKDGGPVAFYVATQCVEVGVDVDFDALVTQAAPLDSLRQRFGRLDRVGARSESDAVVVAAKDEIAPKYDDPIYGDRIPKAWAYLKKAARRGTVDFGVFHFPLQDGWEDAIAPSAKPATLMPAYVRMWSQTRPRPDPDPDPAVFLHGVGTKSADVQVVWRADVTDEMLCRGGGIDLGRAGLAVCKPSQLEAISLPVWIVRRWLEGQEARVPLGDLEGSGGEGEAGGSATQAPCALRWLGSKNSGTGPVTAGQVRPGDTIVVPATRGGCDRYGWDERSKDVVDDLGMEADLIHRHLLTFRFGGPYMSQACPDAKDGIEKMSVDLAGEDPATILDALSEIGGIPEAWSRALKTVRDANSKGRRKYGNATAETTSAEGGQTAIAGIQIKLGRAWARQVIGAMHPCHPASRTPATGEYGQGSSSTDEEAEGGRSGGTKRPLLADHCRGVARFASKFCRLIGMDEKISEDIILAAKLHDAGKAERRVQAFLHRKDPDDLGESDEVIAKSSGRDLGRAEYLRLMRIARLPIGYRHECWSVKMAMSHPEFKKAHDGNLVQYAIGTHHGHGRPLFPAINDPLAGNEDVEWSLDGERMVASTDHGLGRLGSGWIDMCGGLYKKYGPWRLAHIEAIIRLADHCESRGEDYDD